MKTFACGDIVPGCTATFTAPDEDGIFARGGAHAAAVHGLTDPSAELLDQVRAAIVTV